MEREGESVGDGGEPCWHDDICKRKTVIRASLDRNDRNRLHPIMRYWILRNSRETRPDFRTLSEDHLTIAVKQHE